MIFFDTPHVYAPIDDKRAPRCFRGRPSAHLFSDLNGAEGEAELLAFGRRIGMKEAWLQKRGTPDVHFDIVGARIDAARRAGAREVEWREAVAIWRRQRAAAGQALPAFLPLPGLKAESAP